MKENGYTVVSRMLTLIEHTWHRSVDNSVTNLLAGLIAYNLLPKKRVHFKEHLFYKEILGRKIQIFLFDLWHIYEEELNKQEALSNTSAGLFNHFMDLVRQFSCENREVNFYRDKLCVTPKYLSGIVRKGSGYPASYWINAFAAQEIIRLLKTTDMPMQEISDRLHFYNLSHFSRFTKRMLGLSPAAYREKFSENR